MTREVGIVFAAAPVGVVGVNERLLVRLIVKLVAVPVAMGTVITTGDQPFITAAAVAVAGVVTAAGFDAAHVAVPGVVPRAPQT
jgi:hypothetical protein